MGAKICKCKCCSLGGGQAHQVMMFGPEGSGKTTLLYKLRLPLWDAHDIKKDIGKLREKPRDNERPRDPGYHYEEIEEPRRLGRYGIWDVPGSDAFIRLWPMFYRYVDVTAVLFVVDASEKGLDADKVAQARRLLRLLLNEDELRVAAFFLIINVHEKEAKKEEGAKKAVHDKHAAIQLDTEHVETLKEMLQVSAIEDEPWNKNRFKSFVIDCANVSTHDVAWTTMVDDMYRVFLSIGKGS